MTIIKKMSLIFVCAVTVFSGLNCLDNKIFSAIKAQCPVIVDPEFPTGATIAGAGLYWFKKGLKNPTRAKLCIFTTPGTLLIATGSAFMANALSNKYELIR